MHPITPGPNQAAEPIAFERPDSCLYAAVMLRYRVAANLLAASASSASGEGEGSPSDPPGEPGEAGT